MMRKLLSMGFTLMLMAIMMQGSPARADSSAVILKSYLKIGAALSQDQLSEAAKSAKQLSAAILKTDHEKAKSDLLPAVQAISTAKDLVSARKSYEQLSSKLNGIKKDLGIQADEYYCSMVKKSWLQKDSKIVNPYAGKDMSSCGEKKSEGANFTPRQHSVALMNLPHSCILIIQ